MGNKPSTPEEWSKRAAGANKVSRAASEWESTPEQVCEEVVPMYANNDECNVYYVKSMFVVIPWMMSLKATMTIYRASNGELTLFNAFRVPPSVEEKILELGVVKHIVKLGQFHGAGDAYYLKAPKFDSPTYWVHPGAAIAEGLPGAQVLGENGVPVDKAVVSTLEGPYNESVMTVPLNSGDNLLVTADALVHFSDTDGVPPVGRLLMHLLLGLGEKDKPTPAPLWLQHFVTGSGKDAVAKWFANITAEIDWHGVVTAHGDPVPNCTGEIVAETVEKALARFK